ncbi:hypothetical protein N7454_005244, partial [Penicillium verhagenii]
SPFASHISYKCSERGKTPVCCSCCTILSNPVSALKARIAGREFATEKRHDRFVLTQSRKDRLIDGYWICISPMLRDMANVLLQARKITLSAVTLSEDPRIIDTWFILLQKIIKRWGIVSDGIFNFDESGFAMGIGATQKIITSADYHAKEFFDKLEIMSG